jgi:hypothetical protein
MSERHPINQLTRIALLLALTLAVQSLRLPPLLTGPLVNFSLILSTALAGTSAGAVIGLITPGAALLMGIIPPLLAPAIPFIMVGNFVFCLLYGLLRHSGKTGAAIGLVLGALLKFAVIAGAARFLLRVPFPVSETLVLPQLFNALLGGAVALLVSYSLRRALHTSGDGS